VSSAPIVEVRGVKELRKTMKQAGEDLSDLKDVNQAAGNLVVGIAQGMAPSVSGALAGSIRASRAAGGVSIKAGSARVPYAGPIHWGCPARNIRESLFLTNAASQSEAEWVEMYYQGLEKIIDRVKGDDA
jgi:hypothetical protein